MLGQVSASFPLESIRLMEVGVGLVMLAPTDRFTAEKRQIWPGNKCLYDCYGLRRHVLDGYDGILSSTGSANPPPPYEENIAHRSPN